jgi:hypothetical protein
MLPFDHIHVNAPAAEASLWWEKNMPGGRRIMGMRVQLVQNPDLLGLDHVQLRSHQ